MGARARVWIRCSVGGVSSTAAQVLQNRLGLDDDELCRTLGVTPLELIGGGELEHKPELALLLALTDGLDESVLRRWARTTRRGQRPLSLLLARDFGAFEDAVEDLRERGLIIGG